MIKLFQNAITIGLTCGKFKDLEYTGFKIAAIFIIAWTMMFEIENTSGKQHRTSRIKRYSSPRWTAPCGPGHVTLVPGFKKRSQTETSVLEHYETITKKALETKEKVIRIEQLYIAARFAGDSAFEQLDVEDLSNLEWAGLPSGSLSIADLEQTDTIQMVEDTFLDLAKVAVHMEQTRLDEVTYESSQFVPYYMELEEQGIYWLLCELHKLTQLLNMEIGSEIRQEVENIQIQDVNTRAIRHMRDYILLRQFRGVLYKMASKFS